MEPSRHWCIGVLDLALRAKMRASTSEKSSKPLSRLICIPVLQKSSVEDIFRVVYSAVV